MRPSFSFAFSLLVLCGLLHVGVAIDTGSCLFPCLNGTVTYGVPYVQGSPDCAVSTNVTGRALCLCRSGDVIEGLRDCFTKECGEEIAENLRPVCAGRVPGSSGARTCGISVAALVTAVLGLIPMLY